MLENAILSFEGECLSVELIVVGMTGMSKHPLDSFTGETDLLLKLSGEFN